MNLDDRIRQSIDRNTAQPAHLDTIPEGLLRRARRRVALTVAGAVLSVAVLGGGSFLLVRSFGGPPELEPGNPTPSGPVVTEPDLTPEELKVAEVVGSFMETRVNGLGAEQYLSREARADYEGRQDGFHGEGAVLYGNEERPLAEFEVQSPARRVEGGLYEVFVATLRSEIGDTPPCPFTETLLVDPDARGGEPLIVSSVENPPGTIGDPITELGAHAFGCVFMDARASGEDADHLMGPQARDSYASGEGGLDLDAPEPGLWWVADVELSVNAEGSKVTVAYRGPDPEKPEYEELIIAPGADVNGESRQAIVHFARTVECRYEGETLTCD